MLYTEFNVKDREYKLKLNTREIVSLEKKIGCNPVLIFGTTGNQVPTITTMVQILHSSLQAYQSNIDMNKAYEIFDEWLEDGNTSTDFIPVILEIYRVSGLIRKETNEKN